jgi:hypothetical protein
LKKRRKNNMAKGTGNWKPLPDPGPPSTIQGTPPAPHPFLPENAIVIEKDKPHPVNRVKVPTPFDKPE